MNTEFNLSAWSDESGFYGMLTIGERRISIGGANLTQLLDSAYWELKDET